MHLLYLRNHLSSLSSKSTAQPMDWWSDHRLLAPCWCSCPHLDGWFLVILVVQSTPALTAPINQQGRIHGHTSLLESQVFGLGYTYVVFNDKNRNFRHIWTCHHSSTVHPDTCSSPTPHPKEIEHQHHILIRIEPSKRHLRKK